MHEFYKKALVGCLGLIVASVILGYICLKQSYLRLSLLPSAQSALPWQAAPSWDARPGGKVPMQIRDAQQRLHFNYSIAKSVEALAAVDLFFQDLKNQRIHVDLSRYDSVSLVVKCAPANTLLLSFSTFVGGAKHEEYLTYRTPEAYFSCSNNESRVELDLTRLETPGWWFYLSQQDLTRRDYKLDKVSRISIGSTYQSPRDVSSEIQVSALELHGRDRRPLLLFAGVLGFAWSGFALWFFLQHARTLVEDVKGRLQKDLPFVAYQQLSLEPHRDREKTALLQFIASHYADAALDVDRVVEQTGVNRNKVYDILKTEFGFTFSGYLNKLRLTEAARLLAEKDTATVAEIAYSVGYGNVSYFNKLFKEEYGCTPKAFRSACPQ